MKKIILSIAIFFFFNTLSYSHVNHYAKYNYLEYELFRNNNSIGYHKYDFIRDGDNLSIKSEVNFKITKLGVDLYKYFAKSEENYHKGIFKSYSSKTKQNKKDRFVNIKLDSNNNQLDIVGSSYTGKANKEFIVGTWWNHEIVKAEAQISGISGRIIYQTVSFRGKETVKIGNKTYKTLRFNFKSSDETLPDSKKLNTDIWYEEDTYLWVKAAFEKSGYWEYRIKKVN
tara:strand:+ start:1273 stop:1956 length:684 start_codon:yes stop_codon:yes gene_type:complete